MSRAPSVWVTRPEPGNTRTAEFLAAAGVPVVPVPVLRVELVSPPDFSADPLPDWILFVSRNAVAGMDRVWEFLGGVSRSRVGTAAVGKRTADEATKRGWNVEVVPEAENAEGLLGSLSNQDMAGRSVWIPSGNRAGSANTSLPDALRARGAKVRVIPVYETQVSAPSEEDLRLLERALPGAVVLHSPSSAEAVFSETAPAAYRPWRRKAMICIGSVTLARTRALGAEHCLECGEPSDAAVLEVLRSLSDLGLPNGLERKRS